MKPTYKSFEAKKTGGFTALPPVGAYVAEIQEVRFVKKEKEWERDRIECFMEITEGEYKNRFHEVYSDQSEKWGSATYRGIFRLIPPTEDEATQEDDWRKRVFESNLWCVQQSNPGYKWDWDEKKLKGKTVGISLRKRLYTYTKDGEDKDGETIEIAQFETVDDVRNGKCRPMRDRDQRRKHDNADDSTDGSEFTDVSGSVSVPW